jgi:hypothetical protein
LYFGNQPADRGTHDRRVLLCAGVFFAHLSGALCYTGSNEKPALLVDVRASFRVSWAEAM